MTRHALLAAAALALAACPARNSSPPAPDAATPPAAVAKPPSDAPKPPTGAAKPPAEGKTPPPVAVAVAPPEVAKAAGPFQMIEKKPTGVLGWGDGLGITVPAAETVTFEFDDQEKVPTLFELKLETRGIGSSDQVEVVINGQGIGTLLASMERREPVEKVFLPKRLTKKGKNQLEFRNPSRHPWALVQPYVRKVPLPACSQDECVATAKAGLERAESGVLDRARAYQELLKAIVFMEAVDKPTPETEALRERVRSGFRDRATKDEKERGNVGEGKRQ